MSRETQPRAAFSIDEFCARNGICRASLYNYWHEGVGPQFMRVGSRRLISAEAEARWHREREEAAEPVGAANPRRRRAML
jgi:hypothetical protein